MKGKADSLLSNLDRDMSRSIAIIKSLMGLNSSKATKVTQYISYSLLDI